MKVQTIKDQVKKIFGKAQDDAFKAIDEAGGPEVTSKNEEAEALGKGYDELVKKVSDLGEKIEAMGKKKEDKADDAEGEAAAGEGEVSDDDGGMEERLAALEMLVKKLMSKGGDSYDEDEESADEDMEDDDMEESGDEDPGMTGDTKSRAEILSPGIKKTKDVKVRALKAVYGTTDGKKLIESLTGGKKPNFENSGKVNTLFVAASELMKANRSEKLRQTKVTDYQPVLGKDGPMTAEQMNEKNEKFYGKK